MKEIVGSKYKICGLVLWLRYWAATSVNHWRKTWARFIQCFESKCILWRDTKLWSSALQGKLIVKDQREMKLHTMAIRNGIAATERKGLMIHRKHWRSQLKLHWRSGWMNIGRILHSNVHFLGIQFPTWIKAC